MAQRGQNMGLPKPQTGNIGIENPLYLLGYSAGMNQGDGIL